MPLWFPALLSLLPTAWAWRLEAVSKRRAKVGKCVSCGYDLSGLKAAAVCPECGWSG